MSAVVIDLVSERAKRAETILSQGPRLARDDAPRATRPHPFLFWTGSSGARYVHTIYPLFDCPPLDCANYILVKRHSGGRRTVVSIGRAAQDGATGSLADVRRHAADLGANEVHVHLLAGSATASRAIETDLKDALITA